MNEFDLLMDNIKVTIPSRIHIFVSDFKQLLDDQNIGGGLGLSIESKNTMYIRTFDTMSIQSQHSQVLSYICNKLRTKLHYEGYFKVIVNGQFDVHKGNGSSISLISALCFGINRMFNEPFSKSELVDFILNNYYEETDDGKLERVFDTGVGAICSFHGGLNYIEKKSSYLHLDMPTDCIVASFIPKAPAFQKNMTIKEEYDRLHDTITQEKKDYVIKRRLISYHLIPNMFAGDLFNIGKNIKALHQVGSKKVESSFYDYNIQLEIIDVLLKSGALMAGLSSAGPTNYVVFHEKDCLSVLKTIEQYCFNNTIRKSRISQKGVRVLL